MGFERDFKGTDRFEVKRRIGQGGMGVVYEAVDRARGVNVALKILNRFDANAIYRMKQEFRALADVSHPNLAQLHELVYSEQFWFITMELVDGVDFLQWVRSVPADEAVTMETTAAVIAQDTVLKKSEPAPSRRDESFAASGRRFEFSIARDDEYYEEEEETVTMAELEPAKPRAKHPLSARSLDRIRDALRQLAEGMIALHDAGKLHRDIKPSNVMVTKSGRVVLLDFGLVTEAHEEWLIKSTLEGVVVGTIAYMAPEQSAGQQLGAASDWYSVGVMLFEALTGRLPFEGRLFEILFDKQRLDAPAPRDFVKEVPEDLNRLCVDLLSRRPDARPTGRQVLARLSASPEAHTPMSTWQVPSLLPLFVGRERQLAMLEDAYRTVERGRPVIAQVHGRSGMGKSALVKNFLDEISIGGDRVIVLAGRCYEREIVPYKAFDSVIDALSRYLRKLPAAEAAELMGPDIRALARIFPVLTRVEAVQQAPSTGVIIPDPLELRRRAFAALRNMLGLIAERATLVLFIDDLQWGDEDSATLLADLMRPPHPPQLLLITCYRSEDRDTSPLVRAVRGGLGAFAGVEVREVHVGPLDVAESTRLAQSLLAERERAGESGAARPATTAPARPASPLPQAEAIARESAGNPLFVYELASFAHSESQIQTPRDGMKMSPDTPVSTGRRRLDVVDISASADSGASEIKLARALRARFGSIPAEARRLLEIIATAARPIQVGLANRAAGLSPENRTASAVLKAARLVRGKVSQHHEYLETYHNRIGDAVLEELSEAERSALHLEIAKQLEASYEIDPEGLVLHLAAAGDLRRAGEHAAIAADRAMQALAFDRAASLYQICVQLAPATRSAQWDLQRKLGEALANAGRGHEAAEAYLEAAAHAPKTESLELRRRAAQQLLQNGYVDRGIAVIREVAAEVGFPYPDTAKSALRMLNIQRVQLHLRGFEFHEKPPAEQPKDVLAAIDVCWTATTGLAMVDVLRSAYFHTRQLRLALRAGEPYRLARALASEVCLVGGVDRKRERTTRVLEELQVVARKLDEPHAHGLVALSAGFTAFFRGQWSDAILHAERAMQIFTERCVGVAWELDTARIVLFSSLAYRGELRELPERVLTELRQAELRKNLYASTVFRTSPHCSKMWLVLDRVDEARHELSRAMERWSHADFHLQHLYALMSETDFDLYQGEGLNAWSRISRRWDDVIASQLLRIRLLRIEAHFGRARSALAAATQGLERDRLIRLALADARKIEDTDMPWAPSIGGLVRAQVAILRGEAVDADELLEGATRGFEVAGMGLHRAVALRRRGELIGGEAGKAAIEEADRWMRARGITKPERMLATLAPVAAG